MAVTNASSTGTTVPPAVLPGTPKSFPLPPEKLIALAKKIYFEDEVGVKDPSVLAPDFRFEFPVIKLPKQKFLETVSTFDLKKGFPDLAENAYDWRVDKYEPNRVWWTVRSTGTHTGTLKVLKFSIKPTGRQYLGPPECYSLTFNESGQATSLTGGYVMDNRVGNTNRLGALFGIFNAIGVFIPYPQPGTLGWQVGRLTDIGVHLVWTAFHFFTLGLFKRKQA